MWHWIIIIITVLFGYLRMWRWIIITVPLTIFWSCSAVFYQPALWSGETTSLFLRLWSVVSTGQAELPALLTTVFLGHLDEAPDVELSLRLYIDLLAGLVSKGYFTQSQIEDTFDECLSQFQVCTPCVFERFQVCTLCGGGGRGILGGHNVHCVCEGFRCMCVHVWVSCVCVRIYMSWEWLHVNFTCALCVCVCMKLLDFIHGH